MGAELYSLIYVSSAVNPFSQEDLVELLATSRENNASVDVTGMLLYKDGNFMQALEGEEPMVRELYEKIRTDPRHTGEIVLWKGTVRERQFGGWSMGFRDLDSEASRKTPGYSEFLNTPLTGKEFGADATRSQRLLLTFKRSM
jgi:Sensors of blue-light using FAD